MYAHSDLATDYTAGMLTITERLNNTKKPKVRLTHEQRTEQMRQRMRAISNRKKSHV